MLQAAASVARSSIPSPADSDSELSAIATAAANLRSLTVDDPEKKIKVYKAGISNSGNSLEGSFCGACGSSLFVVSEKDPGRIAVTSGTMDDVQGVEGDGVELWKPKLEFFCIRKAKWLTTVGTAQKDTM
ncbi:hypothetical protein COL516b_004808 [Colletotrichum fioriniae]|nr:uncharacterized protein COL516b_004808 [Colletotrichum fioriniae]KAJ0306349.1 hypothetical protein COL516b_004808 [Colletotrichum fioriniae]